MMEAFLRPLAVVAGKAESKKKKQCQCLKRGFEGWALVYAQTEHKEKE